MSTSSAASPASQQPLYQQQQSPPHPSTSHHPQYVQPSHTISPLSTSHSTSSASSATVLSRPPCTLSSPANSASSATSLPCKPPLSTTHLTQLTTNHTTLQHAYNKLKQDFLYNLNLLHERDTELTQYETDNTTHQHYTDQLNRECTALRSEVAVRITKEKQHKEDERQRRVELTASYETKLAVLSEEVGKLRVAVEEERGKADRRVEQVREEGERERREVQRTYESRLADEQRARLADNEALQSTIEQHTRDARTTQATLDALTIQYDTNQQQLTTLQSTATLAERQCRQLTQQLATAQQQLAAVQQQLDDDTIVQTLDTISYARSVTMHSLSGRPQLYERRRSVR